MVESRVKHKDPTIGSLNSPYWETSMRASRLYLWWDLCVSEVPLRALAGTTPRMEQQVKKPFYKKWWFITLAAFCVIGTITTATDSTPTPPSQPVQAAQPTVASSSQTATVSKADALKEFNRLMDLSKQSGLVKSYEMDENTALTIYVSNIWYTQEVQFKKDMVAKFSTLEQEIYGRHRLEVRDAYSNELLAEVTAFSGSIEVYK